MAGKASLFVIAGFSILFLVLSRNFGSVSNRAVDNYVNYNKDVISYNIAVSGANLAANRIFLDPTWNDGYHNMPYQDGELNVDVTVLDVYKNIRQITATGTFDGQTSTVKVKLAPSKFSKFAYYSVNEGGSIWWTDNDTVWGPFHTQDYMRVYRHPVFYGKATSRRRIVYYSSEKKDKPYFFGGYEQGIDLPLPDDAVDDMEAPALDDGLIFTGHDTIYMTFERDTLRCRFSYNSSDSLIYLPTAAPNGLIFAKNSIVRLKGIVKGQYTLGCNSTYSSSKGTIYLDDNIIFDKDPRIYPSSNDLLGICAENDVILTNNTPNHSDINIDASIFCEKGGFGAEDYDSRPPSGNINLLGGIIQNTRKAVGTFSSSGTSTGFNKRYKYDNRLLIASPPFFPGTGSFEIVSWYE